MQYDPINSFLCLPESVLCGPVHTENTVEMFKATLEDVKGSGGNIKVGGNVRIFFPGHLCFTDECFNLFFRQCTLICDGV